MGGGIPDRWLNYSKTGNQIEGTQFVAFKVPLKPELTVSEEDDVQFNISELVERLPNLGLVVDLTNTSRYYDPIEFKNYGIAYSKIATMGHQIPENRLVQQFFRVVKDFLRKNPEKLIGVHCTHGVNRTGYFVCSYLINVESMPANDAIDKFDAARGHKQERENYLIALRLSNQTAMQHFEPANRTANRTQNRQSWRRREYSPLRRSEEFWSEQRPPYQRWPIPEQRFSRGNDAYEHQRYSRRNDDQYGNSRTRWSRQQPDPYQGYDGRYGGSSYY